MGEPDELRVLLCDNHLLGVVKPPGMPAVPDRTREESLLDRARRWVAREYRKPGRVFLGVVHRLDRPVGGVMLFARTSKAAARLSAAWRRGEVAKTYAALVEGRPAAEDGEVVQWLRKDEARNRVAVAPAGAPGAQEARTRWRVLAIRGEATLLELRPVTGRPHQLRLACARALGCPILGDARYGARAARPDGSIALWAGRLEFPHPVGGAPVVLEAPAPFGE